MASNLRAYALNAAINYKGVYDIVCPALPRKQDLVSSQYSKWMKKLKFDRTGSFAPRTVPTTGTTRPPTSRRNPSPTPPVRSPDMTKYLGNYGGKMDKLLLCSLNIADSARMFNTVTSTQFPVPSPRTSHTDAPYNTLADVYTCRHSFLL